MTSKRSLFFRLLFWLAAIALLLLVAAILWLALFFDANTLKPRLAAFVAAQYGRKLDMQGDLKLSFFPGTGIVAKQVTLTEEDGVTPFVQAAELRADVALLPLFSDRLLIQGIRFDGARIDVEKRANGTWNFDNLIPRGPSRFKEFGIGRLAFHNAQIRVRTAQDRPALELTSLDLSIAPLTPALPAQFAATGKWKADGLNATGTLDLRGAAIFQSPQDALLVRDVSAKFSAALAAGRTVSVDSTLAVMSLTRQRAEGFSAAIDVAENGKRAASAQLKSAVIPFALNSVPFTLDWRIESGGWSGRLDGSAEKISDSAWRIGTLQAVAANPDLPAKIELNGSVAIDSAARRAETQGAQLTATLRGNARTLHTLGGDLALNVDAKDALRAEANLAGTLDGSRLAASLRYPAAATSNLLGFTASLDALDLDTWSPSRPSGSREPLSLDLAPLRNLPLQGSLTIGALKSGAVTAKKVRIDVE